MHPEKTGSGENPTSASSIADSMPVSRIREVMELARKDPEAIHLEVGEPDFPTPEHVVEAAYRGAAGRAVRGSLSPRSTLTHTTWKTPNQVDTTVDTTQ